MAPMWRGWRPSCSPLPVTAWAFAAAGTAMTAGAVKLAARGSALLTVEPEPWAEAAALLGEDWSRFGALMVAAYGLLPPTIPSSPGGWPVPASADHFVRASHVFRGSTRIARCPPPSPRLRVVPGLEFPAGSVEEHSGTVGPDALVGHEHAEKSRSYQPSSACTPTVTVVPVASVQLDLLRSGGRRAEEDPHVGALRRGFLQVAHARWPVARRQAYPHQCVLVHPPRSSMHRSSSPGSTRPSIVQPTAPALPSAQDHRFGFIVPTKIQPAPDPSIPDKEARLRPGTE